MNISSISQQKKAIAKATVGGVLVTYAVAPTVAEGGVMTATATGAVWAGYKSANWMLTWRHRRDWVNPLHITLANVLGMDGVKPGKYIRLSRTFRDVHQTKLGRIKLPKTYTGLDNRMVETIIRNKLGLGDEVNFTFKIAGRKPHVVITRPPLLPKKVTFADSEYREAVEKAAESAPLIGIGPRGRKVTVDLDAESPHVLVNAGTGGGKSSITRAMSCQVLHNGGQMVVLDVKRHSHKWARDLANVVYCRDIAEIHQALVDLGEEGHRRNRLVDDWEGEGDPDVGPRMLLIVEESNATLGRLDRYWKEIRPRGGPKTSPALDALAEILFMGRAVRMHVILVAQSATARALGGPEMRENFATRILARYTSNAWKMLVPEVHPIPKTSRHAGRAQVVLGGAATETQVLFVTEAEAREWATSGTLAPTSDLSRHGHANSHEEGLTSGNGRDVTPGVTPHLTLVKAGERRYSLAEAARTGIIPTTPDGARQAKRRHPEGFPEGVGGRYTAEELTRWWGSWSA